MRFLGIVTARGGSKGIPGKNTKLLGGVPLLNWTADAARRAKCLSRVILSTDDESIAVVGRAAGLEVPFLRPGELARDDSPTLPVLQHAVRFVEACGDYYEAIVLLQPTHPFRRGETIDAGAELIEKEQADCVVTVLPVPPEHNPHWVYFADERGCLRLSTGEATPIPRRQLLPPAFHREGSVYITRRDVLMEQNSLYGDRVFGLVLDPALSVNLDTPADWDRAEQLLQSGQVGTLAQSNGL